MNVRPPRRPASALAYLSSVPRAHCRSPDFSRRVGTVSPNCIRQSVGSVPHSGAPRRLAECNSAIQQSITLRYDAPLITYALAALLLLLVWVDRSKAADHGATLYNGIVLPREWPPRLPDFPTSVENDPADPPYLTSPPVIVPIDVGRQLFVDDFLIAETTLTRTFHLAGYHPASPVLKPDQPWEMKNPDHAAAMVFSDGVWYDPKDELFKMWYMVGKGASTGYATSRDGIHWNKPSLDVRPPTNIVQPGGRDSSTVWLDLEEKDPARRFKMFRVIGAGGADPVTEWNNWVMAIHFSPDGIHWGEPVARSGRVVDRSTVFWNPFRKVWVYSIRHVYKVRDTVDKRYGFARRRCVATGSPRWTQEKLEARSRHGPCGSRENICSSTWTTHRANCESRF